VEGRTAIIDSGLPGVSVALSGCWKGSRVVVRSSSGRHERGVIGRGLPTRSGHSQREVWSRVASGVNHMSASRSMWGGGKSASDVNHGAGQGGGDKNSA